MSIENRVEEIVYSAYQMYSGKPNVGVENPFPMYSHNNPTNAFWRGFVRKLMVDGLTDEQVQNLLQSKYMRWMFDADSDKIEGLGEQMVERYAEIALRLE